MKYESQLYSDCIYRKDTRVLTFENFENFPQMTASAMETMTMMGRRRKRERIGKRVKLRVTLTSKAEAPSF